MPETKSQDQPVKKTIFDGAAAFCRYITEPAANVEPKQRLNIRLVSAFFISMIFFTLGAALLLRSNGVTLSNILLAFCAVVLACYITSRSQYYRAAMPLAVVIPAVPPVIITMFQPAGVPLEAVLMWLALPLLAAGLVLSLRQTGILVAAYIVAAAGLGFFGLLAYNALIALTIFLLAVTFFVACFSAIRKRDLNVLETHLAERGQLEKAANKSEEAFTKAFQSSPNAMSISTLADGKFMFVNDSYLRLTGFTREELINQNADHFNIWVDTEQRQKMYDAISRSECLQNRETDVRVKSGEIKTVFVSTEFFELSDKPCLMVSYVDITEYKRAQIALNKSREQLGKIFRLSPQQFAMSRVSDGRFMEINDNFSRVTGYKREEIVGKTALEMGAWVHPEDRARMLEELRQTGRVNNMEFEFRIKSGEILTELLAAEPLDQNGEQCIVIVLTDITERKRMEQALRVSEEKFSKVFQAIPEDVTISRIKDGTFVDVNEGFCRRTEHTREQIIGRTGAEIGLPERPSRPEELIKTIEENGGKLDQELIFNPQTDQMMATLFSARVINIAGEPCLLGVSTDITARKRMEESLANEAIRRRILIEQSSDGIVVLNENGTVFEANHRFAEMLGYSAEEITKLEVHDWEVLASPETNINKLLSTDEAGDHFETKHRRKDGSIYDAEISTNGAIFAGKKLIFSVCRDITERKRMEKAVKESEDKFSKAFQAIPEAVAITRIKDGVIIDVNDNFCHSTRLTHAEIIGHTSAELGLIEIPEQHTQMLSRLKKDRRIINEEIVIGRTKDHYHVRLFSADIIEISGEPCMISVSNDITERKMMERALRESEEKFSKIFRLSPLQIIISRLYADRMPVTIDINDSFLELSGYTREELIGKTIDELNIWKNHEDSINALKMVREQGRIRNFEVSFYVKSGEIHTGLLSSEVLEINGENCAISVLTDITERKQSEEQLKMAMTELKLSSAQLKATNKELESFSYSVSHDLRAPLRSIDGFSQALLEDYAPLLDETARDYLNRMRNASQKMGDLIDGILKLSRLTRGDMRRETVDLSLLTKEIGQRLQETNPERKVEFVIDKDLKVTGDPQMLRSLMENLMGNAWKFTQKVPDARIEFGSRMINDKRTFYIKDNGAGFDMAYADKLFGAFQRLHSTADFPGTGIGLATVQRIINRHGGSIRAEGTVDRGAVFYFSL